MLKSIEDAKIIAGRKVLLRADFNVSLKKSGEIEDSFRLEKALPTLKLLTSSGAKTVILSHLGRDPGASLKPIFTFLKKSFPQIVFKKDFFQDFSREKAKSFLKEVGESPEKSIFLLDNIRRDEKEKENDREFARDLSLLGDIFVNEAFSVSHRKHASVVMVPEFFAENELFGGITFCQEIRSLKKSFEPERPAILFLGGNKINTKLPLIQSFINFYDFIFVGGALLNNFYKAEGLEIGTSFFETDLPDNISLLLENPKIIIPEDIIVQNASGKVSTKKKNKILPDEMVVDVAPKAFSGELAKKIAGAKFILYNGPMGYYEEGFEEGTQALLSKVGESSAHKILGGGNTISLSRKLSMEKDFSFLSTAGGAMIQFLINRTLPGVRALED